MKPSALLKIALRKTSAASGLDEQVAGNNEMLKGHPQMPPAPVATAKPLEQQVAENGAALSKIPGMVPAHPGTNEGPAMPPGPGLKPHGAWLPGDDVASISGQMPQFPAAPGGSDAPKPAHPGTNEGPAMAAGAPAPSLPAFPPKPTQEQLAKKLSEGGTGGDVPNSPSFGVKQPDPGVMARITDWVKDPQNQRYMLAGGAIGAAGLLAYMLMRDEAPKKRRRLAVA